MKPSIKQTALVAALALVLGACASKGPIVDTQGVDMSRYDQDLAQCETYASQVNTGEQAGKSAAAGGLLGAIFGAIVGDSSTVAKGAGVGAVAGGARGAAGGEREKDQVVKTCLRGRGYKVLN